MEKTHLTPLATFRRLPDRPKLCRCETLDCDLCFDTGSDINIISAPLLDRYLAKGFPAEDADDLPSFILPDGTSRRFDACKRLTLPLSAMLWHVGDFRVGSTHDGRNDYLLLGRRLIERYTLQYTREIVSILQSCPDDYNVRVPLEYDDGRYYVKLSVNGREHRFYLDTGHADAIALPERDSLYAISPIHEIEGPLFIGGKSHQVIDHEEERGLVDIGGITRHGPITYADYYRKPYWFNPAMIFADFVIDLKGNYIAFKQN